ncbi:MAG: XRE family transcriptional regulator [Cyanobacteria bacterium P01_D01_bin.115]
MNWYRIENEEAKSVPLETLRSIERVLGTDFEVKFESWNESHS